MNTNNLTDESVSKLFFRYLIPSICGTMVTSIYVLADTIIIGKGIGIDAMAALNIVLPLFNLFFGSGLLFGVGGSVLMSIARGKKDDNTGCRYFSIAFMLNLIACIVLTALFSVFLKPIVRVLGATDVTMPYILEYAPYIIGGLVFFSFSSFLQTFVRNDGAPKLSMIAVITGGVTNIILDMLFVFTFGMGMAGAAIASVIGSVVTVFILTWHFFSKNNGLHFYFKGVRFKDIALIFNNGITSFFLEISSGIVMFVFNLQILKYIGDIGISLYGVITNTVIVVNCLCNGVNQAAQPLISVNFGAGFINRVNDVKKIGMRVAFIICSFIALAGLIVPDFFTYLFMNPNEEILMMSKSAIRIYFAGFFAMGINMFATGYLQSTLKPLQSLILCLCRGCFLSILFVFILPIIFGTKGIWLAMPFAEFVSVIMACIFLKSNTFVNT
ncbi:MAG: MATE family efflux transporter [Lachnospira sp.]